MENNNTKGNESLMTLVLAALSILMIGALFDNDKSKIVSKRGRQVLSDEDKMNQIDKKIFDSSNEEPYSEITI